MLSIRGKNIYSLLASNQAITALCTVFNEKPSEIATPAGSYLYLTMVSDNERKSKFGGTMARLARVAMTIVCKNSLGATETSENVLYTIIDTIQNELDPEGCNVTRDADGVKITEVISDSKSPIFYNEKERAFITKDFLFIYSK